MPSPDQVMIRICSMCIRELDDTQEFVTGGTDNICYTCLDRLNLERERKEREKRNPDAKIPRPREVFDHLEQHVVSQTDSKKRLAVAIRDHCVRIYREPEEANGVELQKTNVLLLGPTGVGKTLLAKTLASFMDVPFIIESATAITEAGYHGQDVENMILRLYEASGKDVATTERGIIYIDEVDKLAVRHSVAATNRDVGGEGVQQALLPMLEERTCNVGGERPGSLAVSNERGVLINTANILFICGGAFVGIEDIIQRRMSQKKMGFAAALKRRDRELRPEDFLRHVTPEDVISYGFIPEFVGRLPVLAALEPLGTEDLVRVLTEPQNSLAKQYIEMFRREGARLYFAEDALQLIADEAILRKTGARGLKSIMEDLLLDIRFEMTTSKFQVTKQFVEGHLARKHIDD